MPVKGESKVTEVISATVHQGKMVEVMGPRIFDLLDTLHWIPTTSYDS